MYQENIQTLDRWTDLKIIVNHTIASIINLDAIPPEWARDHLCIKSAAYLCIFLNKKFHFIWTGESIWTLSIIPDLSIPRRTWNSGGTKGILQYHGTFAPCFHQSNHSIWLPPDLSKVFPKPKFLTTYHQ